jgi:HTH-type transcriptional regulator/antitoxin HigA
MIPKPIRTPEQHAEALKRIDALISRSDDLPPTEQDELEVLALLVQKYEQENQYIATPTPIEAIRFRMMQMNYKQKDLAELVGGASRASEILAGKRGLTSEMMRRLRDEWGIPADSLLGGPSPDPTTPAPDQGPARVMDAETTRQMVRRRYFPELDGVRQSGKDLAARVQRYFEEHAGLLPAPARLRQGGGRKAKINPDAVDAWLLRVARRAVEEKAGLPRWDKQALDGHFLRWLAGLSGIRDKGPRLACEALEKKGIGVILEPRLNQTHLDGAALLTAAGLPVIGLTLRHDRLDNFWFTLFHELGHVLKHLSPETPAMVDCDIDEKKTGKEEIEADRFALDTLIPPDAWERQVRHLHYAEDIRTVAGKLCIDPAVIAGRLRREANDYRKHPTLIGSRQVLAAFDINPKDWLK